MIAKFAVVHAYIEEIEQNNEGFGIKTIEDLKRHVEGEWEILLK